MKLELLDELILLGQGDARSSDCVVAVPLKKSPQMEELTAACKRAQAVYRKTAAHEVDIALGGSLEDFANTPLKSYFHLEVGVLDDYLALKMSHVLGDAVSMLLWLKAVLGVEEEGKPLTLRKFPTKKDTPYRSVLTSQTWPRPSGKQSRLRSIETRTLLHPNIDPSKLNDILSLALLEALPLKRKALWVPVNVRENFWQGFGNGLSRMRLYPPQGATRKEQLEHLRKQKLEAWHNGEIALPDKRPHPALFKAYIARPWADWASISLSHLHDRKGELSSLFPIWGISNISPAHHGAVFVVTCGEESILTLTYDGATVKSTEAQTLMNDFQHAFREIFHATAE